MAAKDQNVNTAVVLQGGGALGAYEYGVLQALFEQRPGFKPVAVAGISIGAITAAVLGGAKGDPISALDTASTTPHRCGRHSPNWLTRQP